MRPCRCEAPAPHWYPIHTLEAARRSWACFKKDCKYGHWCERCKNRIEERFYLKWPELWFLE